MVTIWYRIIKLEWWQPNLCCKSQFLFQLAPQQVLIINVLTNINYDTLFWASLITLYFISLYFFRLFNHGIGIHLLESDKAPEKRGKINPKDNHISFQCSDMKLVVRKLEEMNIEYETAVVEEGGIRVDQLFFHDPDGYMIEICNCQNLPVIPLSSCPLKLPSANANARHTKSTIYGNVLFFPTFEFFFRHAIIVFFLRFTLGCVVLLTVAWNCNQASGAQRRRHAQEK